MTSQDIREKIFEKAVFGGYDMGGVDDFMDEVAVELDTLQKDNSVLRAKLKFLADKIEEYRANEDSMRSTLQAAQRVARQIETEARERADKTIADANAEAARVLGSLQAEAQAEQTRLKEAKAAFAGFFNDAKALCNRQLDYLNRLNIQLPEQEDESVEVDAAVASIEASVARIPDEPELKIDITPDLQPPAPSATITPDDVTRLFNMTPEN